MLGQVVPGKYIIGLTFRIEQSASYGDNPLEYQHPVPVIWLSDYWHIFCNVI